MKSFGLTDKGMVRKDNQDSFIIEKCVSRDCIVAAICDGMGGAKAGGLASSIANKSFVSDVYAKLTSRVRRQLNYKKILTDACKEANGVAYEYSQFDEAYNGMGTTLVGGVINESGEGHIINVGDSRAYYIARKINDIQQITRDHSLVEDLVEYGAITREQARTHPQRSVITRALGSEDDVECDYFHFELQSGDVLLMCSDGLSNMLTDGEILAYAREYEDPEPLCRALMDEALSRGARDNVTIVAVSR